MNSSFQVLKIMSRITMNIENFNPPQADEDLIPRPLPWVVHLSNSIVNINKNTSGPILELMIDF